MPNLPVPGMVPDEEDFNTEANDKIEKPEDLWSPEYSEEQRAVMHQMVEAGVGKGPEEESAERAEVVKRMTDDTLAHLGFKGVDIPTGITFTQEIKDAIGWAAAVADRVDAEHLQPLMEKKLKEMGTEVDPATAQHLGVIAFAYKVGSWRGTDGMGRDGYNETATARETVDRIVAKVSNREAVPSADYVIKTLLDTKIRVGEDKIKKGKGKKPDVRTSAWQNTSENTQELILMILTESAKRLNGNIELDEEGKPYVAIGSEGNPVERHDLENIETPWNLEEDAENLLYNFLMQMLENETEESLREKPVEVGGLVTNLRVVAEEYDDLSLEDRSVYQEIVRKYVSELFPSARVKEVDHEEKVELIITVE